MPCCEKTHISPWKNPDPSPWIRASSRHHGVAVEAADSQGVVQAARAARHRGSRRAGSPRRRRAGRRVIGLAPHRPHPHPGVALDDRQRSSTTLRRSMRERRSPSLDEVRLRDSRSSSGPGTSEASPTYCSSRLIGPVRPRAALTVMISDSPTWLIDARLRDGLTSTPGHVHVDVDDRSRLRERRGTERSPRSMRPLPSPARGPAIAEPSPTPPIMKLTVRRPHAQARARPADGTASRCGSGAGA